MIKLELHGTVFCQLTSFEILIWTFRKGQTYSISFRLFFILFIYFIILLFLFPNEYLINLNGNDIHIEIFNLLFVVTVL